MLGNTPLPWRWIWHKGQGTSAKTARPHHAINTLRSECHQVAPCSAVEQSLALLWINLLTAAFLLVQTGRLAKPADLESTLQKLLHCRSGGRFASYIPITLRRTGVSAAPM